MENPAILKTSGAMLGLKEEVDIALTAIKAIKKELDDELQQTIMKASDLADISKKMDEIQLANKLLSGSINENNTIAAEKVLRKMRKTIFETRMLLAKDIQKSMLKATHDLAEAENALILMSGLNKLIAKFSIIEEKMTQLTNI